MLTFPTTGNKDFKKVPVGLHIARCYRMIDLGTQISTGQFAGKAQRKLHVEWEVFGEGPDFTTEVNGVEMPLTIGKNYTASMHEKAALRKELEAWRGKAFTDDEASQFDVSKLVGAYCMLNVVHAEHNGKTYSNISTITPIPAALKNAKPAGVHSPQVFIASEPDMKVFEALPKYLQTKIELSPEFNKPDEPLMVAGPDAFVEQDSDIPFITCHMDMGTSKQRKMGRYDF